jgi:hypothetical protein
MGIRSRLKKEYCLRTPLKTPDISPITSQNNNGGNNGNNNNNNQNKRQRLATTGSQKGEGRAWQDIVMPIHVARSAIDHHTPSAISISRRSTASSSTRRTCMSRKKSEMRRGFGHGRVHVATVSRQALRIPIRARLLHQPAPAPGARAPHTDGGRARRRDRCAWRAGYGHDASLRQRSRVGRPTPQQQQQTALIAA